MFELLNDNFALQSFEIIDSIPNNESQTAIHIKEHLLDLKMPLQAKWQVGYHRCESKTDLLSSLWGLILKTHQKHSLPMVHIECRGDKEGLQAANGDNINWAELRDDLFLLNCATRNRLIIVFTSCFGLYAARTVTVKVYESTPFRLLVGPLVGTTAGMLEDSFKAFHKCLLGTTDFIKAIAAATEVDPTIKSISATEMFLRGWQSYLIHASTTYKDKQAWLESLVTQARKANPSLSTKGLHKQMKRLISCQNLETFFESLKRRFFMLDRFPAVTQDLRGLTHANVLKALEGQLN